MMKREGWDFNETLRKLAERAGVTLVQHTPETEAEEQSRQDLSAVLEEAAGFFRQQMLSTPAGKKALDYFHKRGLTDETIKVWGLGFAPDSWTSLTRPPAPEEHPTCLDGSSGIDDRTR